MSINRGMDKEDVVCMYIYTHTHNEVLYIYIYNIHTQWNTHTHTHTMKYYSAIKKNEVNAICSYMDGPRDYHTKWSRSERERQISYITYMQNLKYDTNELIYETERDSQT